MILLISLILLAVIFTFLGTYCDWEYFSVTIGALFSWGFLVVAVAALIINPIDVHAKIAEYYATKSSIENARSTSELERAALVHKIIETNAWLASTKYYNKHYFDIFIPDEIDGLEFLK